MSQIHYWVYFHIFIVSVLMLDLGVFRKNTQVISVKSALSWVSVWTIFALIFSAGVFHFQGSTLGFQFLTAYVVEQSLSIDNIFLFVLIFRHFSVPAAFQHRVLFWGVLGALAMRLLLIVVGSHIVAQYSWILYFFGGFLLFTGLRLIFSSEEQPDIKENYLLLLTRKFFRVTDSFQGSRFIVKINKMWYLTPLALVLLLIEVTDLVFAVDSIPAVFAISSDPFIIYTSNVFAILGLRSLYFVLSSYIDRFQYLKYGLAGVLVFIGGKMLVSYWVHIHSGVSLLITVTLLGGSVLASYLVPSSQGDQG